MPTHTAVGVPGAELDPVLAAAGSYGTTPATTDAPVPLLAIGQSTDRKDAFDAHAVTPDGADRSSTRGDTSIESFQALSVRDQLTPLARLTARIVDSFADTGANPQVQDLIDHALTAFINHPGDFDQAALTAFVATVKSQIVGTFDYLAGVARWAIQMSKCSLEISGRLTGLLSFAQFLDLDREANQCEWISQFIDEVANVVNALVTFDAELRLWEAAVLRQPDLVLTGLDLLLEGLTKFVDLSTNDPELRGWLTTHVDRGAEHLGTLYGTVMGFVVFQILWQVIGLLVAESNQIPNIGRASQLLWDLANLPLPSLPSHSSPAKTRIDLKNLQSVTAVSILSPEVRTALVKTEEEATGRLSSYLELLGPQGVKLIKTLVAEASSIGETLNRCIKDETLRAAIAVFHKTANRSAALDSVTRGVTEGFERAIYSYGPYKLLEAWQRHLNQGYTSLYYLRLVADDVARLDAADRAAHSVAALSRSFERAHALDSRGWPLMKPILNARGVDWQTKDHIWSMILPHEIHRGNPLLALERASGVVSPRDWLVTAKAERDEFKSLTGRLVEKINFVTQLPANPKPGVRYIHPASTAEEIIHAHRDVSLEWSLSQGEAFDKEYAPHCKAMYRDIEKLLN